MSKKHLILLVDDEELHRKMVAKIVKALGHAAYEAEDGAAAVELACRQRPDLILMDIQLPGMDGLAATRLLKANPLTSSIPVIALTALAMAGDREKMLAAGCDDYIAKPARYEPLVAKLTEWLGRGAEAAETDSEGDRDAC